MQAGGKAVECATGQKLFLLWAVGDRHPPRASLVQTVGEMPDALSVARAVASAAGNSPAAGDPLHAAPRRWHGRSLRFRYAAASDRSTGCLRNGLPCRRRAALSLRTRYGNGAGHGGGVRRGGRTNRLEN